jgi:hypothetical protein
MKAVYIVDADAKSLAANLNAVAKRECHALRYIPVETPEKLFAETQGAPADLVLLHHTWVGYEVGALVERIGAHAPEARVIVFTGRDLKPDELIECIRRGVCDYWLKSGQVDLTSWSRRVAMYCDSAAYGVGVLSRPSGSVLSLLKEVESHARNTEGLEAELIRVRALLETSSQNYRRDLTMELLRLTLVLLVLPFAAWVFMEASAAKSQGVAFGLVALLMLFVLLLYGKVSKWALEWKGGKASVEAPPR